MSNHAVHRVAVSLLALEQRLGGLRGPITRPQMRLLNHLRSGSRTVSELADRAGITSPGVTQMVDKLAASGYVERRTDPADQRLVRVSVTPEGLEALAEGEQAFEERVRILFSRLSPGELHSLADLLEAAVAPLPDSKPQPNLHRTGTRQRE